MSAEGRLWATALVAGVVMMGAFWAPMFHHPEMSGWGDWQWFHHMWEAGRVAVARWGEPPLWNPHHCGGASLWGNPQAQVFSPTWAVFALTFGTTLGHRLYLLFHAVIGFAGMYALARRELRLTPTGAFFAATMWCGSGFFAWHGAGGHATFISFYWGALLLLAWRRAAADLRWAALVAAIMVLIVAEGGHYPFPYFVLWLALDAAMRLVASESMAERGRVVLAGLVSGGLTAMLGAFRFVPILLSLGRHPHPVPDTDFLTPSEILEMLTAREPHAYRWGEHPWAWPEYGAFIGWVALALALAGLVIAGLRLAGRELRGVLTPRRELVMALAFLVLFLFLTQGNGGEHYPWPLVQRLPFYRSIHVPSRWRVMLIFYLALFAGLALDSLRTFFERRRGPPELRWLTVSGAALVALVSIVEMYSVNLGINDRWEGAPIERAQAARYYLVRGRSYLDEYAHYPSENVGTRECYDPVPWDISPRLWLGEGPQARLAPETDGEVLDWGRTSITVWAEVTLEAPGRVVFNQNFAPGWVSDDGEVVEQDGLLAIDVREAGTRRVSAHYAPPDLPYALGTSALGLLGCMVLVAWPRRRWTRR